MKLVEWEFWPFWVFYVPVYLSQPYFWLRTGSLTFFTAVNPAMKHGGLIDYSKTDILLRMPERYVPRTRHLPGRVGETDVRCVMDELGLAFPIVLKPDRGERAYNVEIIDDGDGLRRYLEDLSEDLIVQELVPEPEEYGIMYCRFPGTAKGQVTSIVHKQPMTVTGDGVTPLGSILRSNRRCMRYIDSFEAIWRERLDWVPEAGEQVVLNRIGNHVRGSIFRNRNDLICPRISRLFDEVAGEVEGFHLGRFDVKTESFRDLLDGRFKIIEVNGVNSEPAHIYDPDNSLRAAYRDLLSHWNLIASVARASMQEGVRPDRLSELLSAVQRHLTRKKRIQVTMT